MSFTTIIGLFASALTAFSLIPQLIKLIKKKESKDLSVVMLSVLISGLGMWIYYGFLKEDAIIIVSNAIACLINAITLVLAIYYKRDNV